MTQAVALVVGMLAGSGIQWLRCAVAVRDAEDAMHAAMAEAVRMRAALADDERWAGLLRQRPFDWEDE